MSRKIRLVVESDKYSMNILLPAHRVIPFSKKLKKEYEKTMSRKTFLKVKFEPYEQN